MDDLAAFERQVADVARLVAGPPRPVDVVSVMRSASAVTTAPVSRVSVTTTPRATWRWKSALGAVLLLVAAAVALVGGLVLTGGSDPMPPSAEDEPGPYLPAVIPAGIPHGTIDTLIGSARWAHLSGDPSTLPGPLTPMPGLGGLVWFDEGGDHQYPCEGSGELECLLRPQLWTSSDAISERVQRTLPVVAEWAQLTPIGGTWWLRTGRPTTLWRSSDLNTWERIDLEALVSPGPAELDWELQLFGEPAAAGGTTVFPVAYEARDAGRLLGRPDLGSFVFPERAAPGRYRVMEDTQGGPVPVGDVWIEETASGLRFADLSGGTIATLEGVGIDFVEAWAVTQTVSDYNVAVVDGDAVTPVSLPGGPLSDHSDNGPVVLGTDTGFHAFKSAADGTIRTWRSTDGRTWMELDPPAIAAGEPRDIDPYVGVQRRWGRPSVVKVGGWESEDGRTWVPVPVSPMGESGFPVAGGWLQGIDGGWYASIDGNEWKFAPTVRHIITKSQSLGAGSYGVGAVIGDTVFVHVDEKQGARQRDLWILEFDRAVK
jgi:hypothetical protein